MQSIYQDIAGIGGLTVPQRLQPFGLAAQRPSHLAHALARGIEPVQTGLNLLGQLRRLFEPRAQNINFSPGFFFGGVALAQAGGGAAGRQADGHHADARRQVRGAARRGGEGGKGGESVVGCVWRGGRSKRCRIGGAGRWQWGGGGGSCVRGEGAFRNDSGGRGRRERGCERCAVSIAGIPAPGRRRPTRATVLGRHCSCLLSPELQRSERLLGLEIGRKVGLQRYVALSFWRGRNEPATLDDVKLQSEDTKKM